MTALGHPMLGGKSSLIQTKIPCLIGKGFFLLLFRRRKGKFIMQNKSRNSRQERVEKLGDNFVPSEQVNKQK